MTFDTVAYQVTEGIHGYWHYHLSPVGKHTSGLCGAQTMTTSIPLSQFGVGRAAPPGAGISGKWCKECQRRAGLGVV